MKEVFLGLGGNIGAVTETLRKAEVLIRALPQVSQVCFSRLYQTSPVSDIPQDDYINCVCRLFTDLRPEKLFLLLQGIENQLGKIKKAKNEPRTIDIDVLLFGDEVIHTEELEIPHPRWRDRLFVLVPLAEFMDEVQPRIQELQKTSNDRVELL
jgi:2-amino-4-hydroxy-6-hydroxymethyldihydropteridine diphosphokinase